MTQPLMQCDCCDYFTIPEGDDYEICPVCFWEQDSSGISELEDPSGANHGLSLREGRENFISHGACAPQFKAKVIPVAARSNFRYVARSI